MNILKRKIFLAIILLFAFSFKLFANESITFTWKGGAGYFSITATPGKQFTINWGDGSAIETITGIENNNFCQHYYSNSNVYTVSINALSNECKFTHFYSWEEQYPFNTLNVTNAPSLIVIEIYKQNLTSLDVSKNTALQTLKLGNNQLTNLDVSKNIALIELECDENQLFTLNVSKNTKLTNLFCQDNSLNSLDVSNCINLKTLCCSDNKIVELDVSKNKNITSLYCENNNITNLTLGNSSVFTKINCSNNKLKSLDVSKCTKLEKFYCSNNQIANLDVSKNLKLKYFVCSSNQLPTLDISQNNYIEQLYCRNNRIKKIELNSDATIFEIFDCMDNHLPLSELYFLSNKIKYENSKWFGTQRLEKKYIPPGANVDFSSQNEFGGIKTVFTVEKNGMPASASDYTLIDEGIFKFNKKGDYTISMTNDAIVSSWQFQTLVIAEISVREVGVAETQRAASLHLYPNPVSNTLYINLENAPTPPEVKIYSLQGVLLLQTQGNQIDVSSLPAGFYVANVNGINRKIIKQY